MIQPGPVKIGQVDGKELDDDEIIVRSALSTREAVVLQPDARVSFVVVLDDVAWCLKMLWEMSVTYDASERLCVMPFRTEVVSFMIIMSYTACVLCVSLGLRIIVPWMVPSSYMRFRPSTWAAQPVVG
jgi:hypothetical protein